MLFEVIGVEAVSISSDGFSTNKSRSLEEQVPYEWIPPKKSMVQFFAEKVSYRLMLTKIFFRAFFRNSQEFNLCRILEHG